MRHVEQPPRGAPLWCVSYGDMMSLLLGFFILLYALAGTKKEADFDQFAEAMKRQFGFTGDPSTWFPGPHRTFGPRIQETNAGSAETGGGSNGQRPAGANEPNSRLSIPSNADAHLGVVMQFSEASAALTDAERTELKKFADKVRGKRQKIEIRGHASGRPPQTGDGYRDAWDLAFQRSYATMQYLVQQAGIESERIRLSAAGQNERSTGDGAGSASRVEVFLLDEMIDDRRAGEPAAPASWSNEQASAE
jgi:chemotaxis protein MotB